jgi:hypothetical protein
LAQDTGVQVHFPNVQKIHFENHYNPLLDESEGSADPMLMKAMISMLPDQAASSGMPDSNELRADQICVYEVDDQNNRRLVYVVEYKPPHKLTLPHLRQGLREMDIYQDVVNRAEKPSAQGEELFQYHADQLVAAAVVQTFHYMIEGGLEYAYLTTGEGFVFLKIDWKDPTILYYHLAEPKEEANAHGSNARHCTAISQVLAFTLLATNAPIHGQAERKEATARLNLWQTDFATILSNIPETERKQTPPPSSYNPRTYKHVDRSPYLLRNRIAKMASCGPDIKRSYSDPESDESSDDHLPYDSPIRPKKSAPRNARSKEAADTKVSLSSSDHRESGRRRYCTQKCLIGLVRNGLLDKDCPNVSCHRRKDSSEDHHPLDHETWLGLLHDQLSEDLDHDIEPLLDQQGARGAIFRVTLSAYGYTFLAKGTVPVFVEDLAHEAAVYQRLEHLQGVCVPVFLGAVKLEHPYYYDFGVRIGHMVFLSWAGHCLNEKKISEMMQHDMLSQELIRSLSAVHSAGVLQADVRAPNALWNGETDRVFVIDFERAHIVNDRYLPLLQESSSNPKGLFSSVDDRPIGKEIPAWLQYKVREEIWRAGVVFRVY